MTDLASRKRGEAAALCADLDDAVGGADGIDDAVAFFNGVAERLFDIDVFAGADGVDEHSGVPMVRCGDDDGVDGFVVEELSVVFLTLGTGGGDLEACLDVWRVDVADRGDLEADFFELAGQEAAATAGTDEAEVGAAVCAEDALVGGGGGEDGAAQHGVRQFNERNGRAKSDARGFPISLETAASGLSNSQLRADSVSRH